MARTYDASKLSDPEYRKWLAQWNVDVDEKGNVQGTPQSIAVQAFASESVASDESTVTDDTDEDEDDAPEDFADWTVDELREELGKLELSKSGDKAELIARLEAAESE